MKRLGTALAILLVACGGGGENQEREAALELQHAVNTATTCVELADLRRQALDQAWLADDSQAGYMFALVADEAGQIGEQMGCRNLGFKEDED